MLKVIVDFNFISKLYIRIREFFYWIVCLFFVFVIEICFNY